MRRLHKNIAVVALGLVVLFVPAAGAQQSEERTIVQSISVLNEIMTIPNDGIPKGMLRDAHAVVIVPNVLKGSFFVGARFGNGVLLVRDPNGGWHAPVFISLSGGNVGWQIGVQSTDVILVFKTPQSVQGLLNGKFTIGADAAVAAGPVGRQAAAATDGRLSAEIYSWSRSRGLFAGVALDGSMIQIESGRNQNYYRPAVVGGPVVVPNSAQQLAFQVHQYSGLEIAAPPAEAPSGQVATEAVGAASAKTRLDLLRDDLAQASRALSELLDQNWQGYLALPAEVYTGTGHPAPDALQSPLARFEAVRADGRYAALSNNQRFLAANERLQRYAAELAASAPQLNLPPPPR